MKLPYTHLTWISLGLAAVVALFSVGAAILLLVIAALCLEGEDQESRIQNLQDMLDEEISIHFSLSEQNNILKSHRDQLLKRVALLEAKLPPDASQAQPTPSLASPSAASTEEPS